MLYKILPGLRGKQNFQSALIFRSCKTASSIQNQLQERDWDENSNDVWSYNWGHTGYSRKKAYSILIGNTEASPLFPWLWASSNLGKHKFFFWLLIKDRLNTRNLLRRKNMELDDYNCVLCNASHEETSFHLFFECAFSQACWNTIPVNWNMNLPPLDKVIDARTDFGSPLFREIFITACWAIWTTRNAIIFDNGQINVNLWNRQFKEELGLVCTKVKPTRQASLSLWRDSYLL